MRAVLQAVERNLDDELRSHVHHDALALSLELEQTLRLPFEQLVGEPFERLAEHHESTVRIARAEVQVGEFAVAPAMPPLGGEHDEIERVRLFDLEPRPAPPARFVPGLDTFGHEAFLDRKSTRLNSSH